jgi:hypothetical protein
MTIVTADGKRVGVGDQVVYDQDLEYVAIKSIDPYQWAQCVSGRGQRIMLNGIRMLGNVRPLGAGFVEAI